MEAKGHGLVVLEHEGYTIESTAHCNPDIVQVKAYLKGELLIHLHATLNHIRSDYAANNRVPSYRTRKYMSDHAITRLIQLKEEKCQDSISSTDPKT